jgi:hypothetical protein
VLNQLIAAMNRAAAQPDNDKYADDLTKISVSKCPADFQAAWKKFRLANVEFLTHNKLPEVILSLVGIIHGSAKGIESHMERADDLRAATLELKAICNDYGIDASHIFG